MDATIENAALQLSKLKAIVDQATINAESARQLQVRTAKRLQEIIGNASRLTEWCERKRGRPTPR